MNAQRGVTYLALLLAVAITSGVLAAGTSVWSHRQQRERETQLLWAGDQIRRAIVAYARAGSSDGQRFPATLQDLLLDPRSAAPQRYLRRLYDDPMTGSTDWGLIRNAGGRIVGVHSTSQNAPLKTGRFPLAYAAFEEAATYADWRFTAIAEPRRLQPREPAGAASSVATDRAAVRAPTPANDIVPSHPLPAASEPAAIPPAAAASEED
jgi:type II secretory pathway pseudopilin PulG